MNLTVVGLSRDAEKRTKLKALGADFVFDPEDRNLPRSVSAAISPKKVHLAVDCVGGKLLSHVITMLGYGGRISVVGRSAGPVPEFNTATLLFRRIRIGGVSVGDHTAQIAQAAWKEIVGRLETIGQRPQVDSIIPFEEVERMNRGNVQCVCIPLEKGGHHDAQRVFPDRHHGNNHSTSCPDRFRCRQQC